MDKETVRPAVAHSVEVVVRAMRDDTTVRLQGAGLEDEVRRDLIRGNVRVRGSDGHGGASGEALIHCVDVLGVVPGIVDVDVVDVGVGGGGVDELAAGSGGAGTGALGRVEVGAELESHLVLLVVVVVATVTRVVLSSSSHLSEGAIGDVLNVTAGNNQESVHGRVVNLNVGVEVEGEAGR